MAQLPAASTTTVAAREMEKAATAGSRFQQRNIASGELWLGEISPEASELPFFELRPFVSADIVIYDRVLVRLVTAALPVGNYAEPSDSSIHSLDKTNIERYIRLALDGWRIIWLVNGDLAESDRADRLLRIRERLLSAGVSPDFPVQVLTDSGNPVCPQANTRLGDLHAVLDARTCEGRLTGVFTIGRNNAPVRFDIGNGLAG
jgi:hypothetical protein